MESPKETHDALRQIDEELGRIHESARQLKSRRNALAPVSRLPPELLARIFLFCATPPTQDDFGGHSSLSWMKEVSHICQHWREVALGCPRLWSNISFSRPHWVEEMLKRSKMAPLSVKADMTYITPRQLEALKSSLEHVGRTTELHMLAYKTTFNKYLTVLDKPAPMLESLFLRGPRYNRFATSDSFALPDSFLNAHAPNLRRLELDQCSISWSSPLLHNLRDLRLHDSLRPSMSDLLPALEAMKNLTSIDLKNCLPSGINDHDLWADLPGLKHITLEDNAEECVTLLSRLQYPTDTLVKLRCHSPEDDFSTLFDHLSATREALPTIRSLTIDQPIELRIIQVQAWSSIVLVDDLADQDPAPPQLDIKLQFSNFRLPPPVIEETLCAMTAALNLSRLRMLGLNGGGFTAASWLQCFGSSPLLRHIYLHSVSAEGLIEVLQQTVDESSVSRRLAPGSRTCSPGPSPLPPRSPLRTPRTPCTPSSSTPRMAFPTLQKLILTGIDFNKCPLAEALRVRRNVRHDCDLGPAEVVLNQCLHVSRGDVVALEVLVPSVRWDGMEIGFSEDEGSLGADDDEFLQGPLGIFGYSPFGGNSSSDLDAAYILGGAF
ncbi:hypothetical protein HGRIS_004928 [Hohenbuehelia grisea]|uniref:F-box domain-containing protein n=1 Tax=Hohenbuehelia grisea TaxID=104357 RepID=A0ABR3JDN2_9AGAR